MVVDEKVMAAMQDGEFAAYAVHNQMNPLSRTVYMIGRVDGSLAERIIPQLHVLDQSEGDITIVVSSEGGDVYTGMAIYATIRGLKNKVRMIGIGRLHSMGAVLFQAGDERLLDPACRVMLHSGTHGVHASWEEFVAITEETKAVLGLIKGEIRKRTGLTKEEVDDLFSAESYMSASAAVRLKLADRVVRR